MDALAAKLLSGGLHQRASGEGAGGPESLAGRRAGWGPARGGGIHHGVQRAQPCPSGLQRAGQAS